MQIVPLYANPPLAAAKVEPAVQPVSQVGDERLYRAVTVAAILVVLGSVWLF